jgi:hypothetical protein
MAGKNSKTKKQLKPVENAGRKSAQILFAVFAIILILSMLLSAVTNF